MRAAKRMKRAEPLGRFNPAEIYTKRGLNRAIGISEEELLKAQHAGIVTPGYSGGKNYYRGSEIEAWIWSEQSRNRDD